MLGQLDIYGRDKVQVAIDRFKDFEKVFKNDEGFFLAFSGGKDSVVIKALADMAGVKYDAHYHLTSADPPELVAFIMKKHPDVIIDKPRYPDDYKNEKLAGKQITMWNLIPEKKMPPTMIVRYCCAALKESCGDGRLVVTGVRWAESVNRKNNQGIVTVIPKKKKDKEALRETGSFKETAKSGFVLVNDNEESRDIIEHCYTRNKTLLNPIIDWTDEEVWEFIHEYGVPYCELYDKGRNRIGCIGCPMSRTRKEELEEYPKYKAAYMRAFDELVKNIDGSQRWKSAEEVYKWWVSS